MIRLFYTLLGIALTPLLYGWLGKRALRGKEDRARLGERFGRASAARPQGRLFWLHAASVGETQSVLTLVRALLRQYPEAHLLVTTGTVTSAGLVAQQNIPHVIHQYLPLDTFPTVRRFLNHWQPDLVLWVESEFWPQLLWQVRARHIPLLLINARLSARTFARWKRLPFVIRPLLACFDGIYAGSSEDAGRLRALGARDVIEAGNLKYDAEALPVNNEALSMLTQSCEGRSIWVAASTHGNEEQMAAEAHRAVAGAIPSLLTIIVPRHASRGDAIAADLRARGFALAQRSKQEPVTPATAIYLADTMGELGTFYRLAELAFIGGSLIAHGGHNPLEPARLHCALLTGPHTHNFATIIDHLKTAEAIRVVGDTTSLGRQVESLLSDDAACLAMAERAAAVVGEAGGAANHILQHIATFFKEG